MKRILSILLIMIFMITLASCSLVNELVMPENKNENKVTGSADTNTTVPKNEDNSADIADNNQTTKDNQETTESSQEASDNTQGISDKTENDALSDFVVVLDAGHGGGYSGASYDGRVEKELTLQLALEMKEYLNQNYPNLNIYLTRDSDKTFSENNVEELELRAQYAKDVNADLYVSLHFNASEEHNQSGCMAFVSLQKNVNEAASFYSENILQELENLGLTNHGVKTRKSNDMFDENGDALDYYAINRHCANRDIPGIIIEHCFMDNKDDIEFLDSDTDIEALAQADAKGIVAALTGMAKQK